MDIKEIAKRIRKTKNIYMLSMSPDIAAKFAEALIESYKAELLKEVGEPVAYMCSDEELCRKGYERFSRHNSGDWSISVFTSDQVAAAILKATKPLEDQLAKAEQRVAEYNELIYAVQTKNPDETRHQTALRYIRNAENRPSNATANGASS